MKIRAPRVRDKVPEQHFTSTIFTLYKHRAPQLEIALPVYYLRGLSAGDFQPALTALLGEEAVMGFSASTITRQLNVWQDGYQGWRKRSLAAADGVPGYLEGYGPDETKTEEQPYWVDKIANVLDMLPRRPLPRAKAQLHEIMRAPDLQTALYEIGRFATEFDDRYQNAVHTLGKVQEKRLNFFNGPAARWIHLRTTTAIETTLATVKARTRTTRRSGSRQAGLATAFKLLQEAEEHWRRVNSPRLVALVQADVKIPDGKTRILPVMPEQAEQAVMTVRKTPLS